jgi:hypothetical protein
MPCIIKNGDRLFRGIHHPVSFKSKAFDLPKFWSLRDVADAPGTFETSLTWQKLAPTLNHVNQYGCRLSAERNERRRAAGRGGKDLYCGAYEFCVDDVRSLPSMPNLGELNSADVLHVIETDEIAHCNLTVSIGHGADVEGAKTAIIDRLWNVCRGPVTHVCACDAGVVPHPNQSLRSPPSGAYTDRRSWLSRRLDLLRFALFTAFWRLLRIAAKLGSA